MKKAIISIGNPLKSDDNIANLVLDKIKFNGMKIKAEISPENFIRPVVDSRPGLLVFIDAVDWGARPGMVKLFAVEDTRTLAPSTHNMPLDLLKKLFPETKILVIGIQPKDLGPGTGLSPELKRQFGRIVGRIEKVLSNY